MYKILKLQNWLLLLLALINAAHFVLSGSKADHSLHISSLTDGTGVLSYFFYSMLSLVHYYVGVWVLAPAVVSLFLYHCLFVKRHKEFDLFIPALLSIFFFFASYSFMPELLGEGLDGFSTKYIDWEYAIAASFLTGFISLFIIFRGSFLQTLKVFWLQIISFIQAMVNSIKISYLKIVSEVSKRLHPLRSGRFKVTLSRLLRAQTSRTDKKRLPLKPVDNSQTPSSVQLAGNSFFAKRKRQEDRATDSNQFGTTDSSGVEVENQDFDSNASHQQSETAKHERVLPSKRAAHSLSEPDVFFKSSELIECISDNTNHQRLKGPDDDYFNTICSTIESKLNEFNVKGQIINILKGPVVDTFELELGEGIKASRVKGLEDDLGLALNGAPIRVVYPLKGRSTIGIEVPRSPRDLIYLDEVLQNPIFNESRHRLPIAMGKDAFGEVAIADLAGMPHMLVAGATGAGKSVFINTLLVSLIIKKSPRELKLILIDPKQLELALFSTLPHLMLPVITEARTSAVALLWAVEEMERRYTILKELGVKNIEGFNKKIATAGPSLTWKIDQYYENADENGYELPYIVIVIDEFADLILTKSGKDIELNVNRLAAKARAAGIHLVLATQRPSTDVITGVIKANFPTRVAFRVTSGHDSKTILDIHGAQKLLGKGDMLYKQGVELLRLHSAFVEEGEVEVLVNKLSQIEVEFNDSAMKFLETQGDEQEDAPVTDGSGNYLSGTSEDPVYKEALEVVAEVGQASASMLQRRLRVGYNRASNLIDELERNGVVGPAQGSKPRKVLIRPE